MGKMIYVVTSGEYSDYHIEAVFSRRDLADTFVGEASKGRDRDSWSDAGVEEFELDIPPNTWWVILVRMAKNGDVLSTESRFNSAPGFACYDTDNNLVWQEPTLDVIRAVKAVNKKRAMLIALNVWGDTDATKAVLGSTRGRGEVIY